MKKAFLKLSEEKKDLILNISLKEFSEKGYENCSYNDIIKKCEISKGGMYKYFESKETLYRYLVKKSIDKYLKIYNQIFLQNLKEKDIYDVFIIVAELEFDFYIDNSEIYNFFKKVFVISNEKINLEIREEYIEQSQKFLKILFGERKETELITVMLWILEGYNKTYFTKELVENSDVETIKKNYIKNLKKYFSLLKK